MPTYEVGLQDRSKVMNAAHKTDWEKHEYKYIYSTRLINCYHPSFWEIPELSESGAPCMLIECLQLTLYVKRHPRSGHGFSEGRASTHPFSTLPRVAKMVIFRFTQLRPNFIQLVWDTQMSYKSDSFIKWHSTKCSSICQTEPTHSMNV